MKSGSRHSKSTVAGVALVLVVTSFIAQPLPAMAQTASSVTAGAPCNTAKTAVVGAVIGGLLGRLTHHKVVGSAAVGGAVAAMACVAINYQSHRTQTAEQVRQANPQVQQNSQVAVTKYQLQVHPGTLLAGQLVTVSTDVSVLAGTNENIQTLGVRYDLLDTVGKVQKSFTKLVSGVQLGGGSYQSTITFTPPRGVPHGSYSVRADLLVNGQVSGERQGKYTVI